MVDALKATRARAVLVAGALAIIAALALQLTGALDELERGTIDTRFAVRGAEPTDEIVVVAIDEDTFSDLSNPSFPFKRTLHAEVVDRLREAGCGRSSDDALGRPPRPAAGARGLGATRGRAGRIARLTRFAWVG